MASQELLGKKAKGVKEFDPSHWDVLNSLAAQTGLKKSTLLQAIFNIFFGVNLAGGVADYKMGVEVRPGVWRSVRSEKKLTKSVNDDLDTLQKIWKNCSEKYSNSPCMGSRDILQVRMEGKFEKYVLSDYNWITFKQAWNKSLNFGNGLKCLGVDRGDIVNFFADTKMEWQLAAQGCFQHGIVVATTYANLGEEAVTYGIDQTETEVVFTDAALVPLVSRILKHCPKVKHVIFTSDKRPEDCSLHKSDEEVAAMITAAGVECHSFDQICSLGKASSDIPKAVVQPEDLAVIMYTSGSTGNPKGVMISHQNLSSACRGLQDNIPDAGPGDYYLAYLPLAHILELTAETCLLGAGAAVGYGSTKTVTDSSVCMDVGKSRGDAPQLRPTLMAAVPIIMDKIRAGVTKKVKEMGGLKAKLFSFAYAQKVKAMSRGHDAPLWNKLVFDKLRTTLLGGRLRFMASGGGPLSKKTQDFMNVVFCCPVGQGYGLTETMGSGTMVWCADRTSGRVGAPITCTEIKLIDWEEGGYYADPECCPDDNRQSNPRGEVVFGGNNVSLGYFKNPEKTAESYYIDDEGKRWFRTGDIGEMYPDGVLALIDRKKDLVKLSGGEYVSYGKLEPLIRNSEHVDNCMVHADPNENHCVVITTRVPGADTEVHETTILEDIQRILREAGCVKFEIPKKIHVSDIIWGPDNDLCTAALKLKRHNLRRYYSEHLEVLYERK
mmetsp:Transcript_16179/g.21262  ORF Transcript_16179/g.21262 Transcript_16179/m.21262 type:complete len:719 (-) Transcript_16179:183-2339(-)